MVYMPQNQNSSLVLHDVSGDRTKHANLHSGNNLQAILQPSARYFDNSYQEGAVGRSDNRNNVDRGGGASIDLYVAETPKSPPGKTPRHLLEMQLIQERQYLQVQKKRGEKTEKENKISKGREEIVIAGEWKWMSERATE